MRDPNFDQQSVAGDFQELHQIMEIAQMCDDHATANKIRSLAESQFSVLDSNNPGMGGAFKRFFDTMGQPQQMQAQDTATHHQDSSNRK